MARSRVSFDEASQSLLDAAVDPTRWNDAMEAISQYSGATGVILLQIRGRGPGTPHTRSMEEGVDAYFRDGWHLRDERVRGIPFMRTKGISVDQDFASREELASSDYYQFLRSFGFNWSAAVGVSSVDDEWALVIERGDKHGPVTPREQADFVRFGAHLNRAALVARNLGYANAVGMLDAYHSLGCASILLDRFGRTIRHNTLVEPLLGDGLELSHGMLRCAHPGDSMALENMIARLGYSPGLNESDVLPPVVVRRPLKRPLVVHGIRLKGMASAAFSPAKSILLISDTEKPAAITSVDVVRQAFGLTPAEAALLVHLERELPLSASAELMGISIETARSHLKRVFGKTDTNRQSDLLLLLRRLRPGS